MGKRELRLLTSGGVGGRLSPSVAEDQSESNAWQGMRGLAGPEASGRRHIPASTATPPPAPKVPAPVKIEAQNITGSRIQDVRLLDEYLQKHAACRECVDDAIMVAAKTIVGDFVEKLSTQFEHESQRNTIKEYAASFKNQMHKYAAVKAAVSAATKIKSSLHLVDEERRGLVSTLKVSCPAGHKSNLETSRY
jgi:hypothetical protein